MRALIPALIAFPLLVFARPVWACDHDDDDNDNDSDSDDDIAEVEPPEAPEPPEPPDAPERWVASVFQTPHLGDVDIDIHWDVDVRWNDHGDDETDRASELVRDQINDLQRQLEDATRDLHIIERD